MKVDDPSVLQAEIALLRAQLAALQAAEEKFRVLFDYSADAHLIFNERGIIDCNRAAIEMLRCRDKAQVMSLHPAVLSPERQPDGQRSLDKSVEMDRLARERGVHRFEWTHRRMTGEDFPVEVTLTPVTLIDGPALLVSWHDLTEIKAREAALHQQISVTAEQQRKIHVLSMPVIEVQAGVVMVPVLGDMDLETAGEMTHRVLSALSERRAWAVILDLTGLREVSPTLAGHLLSALNATRLLGAEGMVVGVQPSVARAMVAVAADLSGVRIFATLREAIEWCRRRRS